MKRIVWIIIAFAIVVVLVAAEAAVVLGATSTEARVKVVYAGTDIGRNTVITPDMLVVREIDARYVHPDALKNTEAAISKRAVMEIESGEMLLGGKLTAAGSAKIVAKDKTKRLFSVKFEGDQANGWQLAEGQLVDIIYVPNKPDTMVSGRDAATSGQDAAVSGPDALTLVPGGVMILRNIRIAGLIKEDGNIAKEIGSEGVPRYVSFEVTEEQAGFLAYAKNNGKLELSSIPDK